MIETHSSDLPDRILSQHLGLEQFPNRAFQGARRQCERCRGTGRAALAFVGGVPNVDGREYRAICPHCGGTGRKRLWTK